MPCPPGAIPRLSALAKSVSIVLMIDNVSQIQAIEAFVGEAHEKFGIFVKLDMEVAGSRRAGLPVQSVGLMKLIDTIRSSRSVHLHGFYAHAGHSYQARDSRSAAKVFEDELRVTIAAAEMLTSEERKTSPLILAVGATPTVNAAYPVNLNMFDIPSDCTVELHAGMCRNTHVHKCKTNHLRRLLCGQRSSATLDGRDYQE